MRTIHQRGVTMIEVLVTLFVLAIGLTGILSVESYAMRMNHESYLRTQAVLQVQEIADRMHANLEGVSAGHYSSGIPSVAPTQTCQKGKACTPAQLAAMDKWEWHKTTGEILPSGTGTIDADGSRQKITIQWLEKNDSGGVTRSFVFHYKPLPLNLL